MLRAAHYAVASVINGDVRTSDDLGKMQRMSRYDAAFGSVVAPGLQTIARVRTRKDNGSPQLWGLP
jgi:hypothetical protein